MDRTKSNGNPNQVLQFQHNQIISKGCTVGKKNPKQPYLFQYKLSYRNETDTNHHGLLPTTI